ncbi:MAG: YcgN family cysteine cluster protein [Proteobacteria bacterium]|jgi:uncharacterized protein|nr:YcgN family cysteine cluster protein [Pseudomonadota bacterium]
MSKQPEKNFCVPFWKSKRLAEMSRQEWESVCDGCAKCCLNQLEDIETGMLVFTDVCCELLDQKKCRCTRYDERKSLVSRCMVITPENIDRCSEFAPSSCAYRLLYEGKELPIWHPLISGNPDSVVEAGMSVRGRIRSESSAGDDWEEYVVDWPEDC